MRSLRATIAVATLAICSCSPTTQATSEGTEQVLQGKWLITAIDGEPARFAEILEVDFGPEVIRLVPGCAEALFIYSQDGEGFRADRVQFRYDEGMDPSYVRPPPCAILIPGQQEAAERIAYAERARWTEGDTVSLNGRRGSVTITRAGE